MKITLLPTGTGRDGNEQIFIAPSDGVYRITAAGAAGSGGNAYGTSFTPTGGRGAIISADFTLKSGDVLRLVVGQPGGCVQATAKDGASGGGGGATFAFRNISAVTDSRYQYTKAGQAFEALLVAAGGGGSNDSAYQGRQDNGLDGIGDTWYSPTNYVPPTSSSGTGGAAGGSVQQYISYDARGFYYSRNTGQAVGGYGGGGASDDSRAGGGGWSISDYQARSWCAGGQVSGQTGGNAGGGYVTIEWTEIMSTLITDRTQADVLGGTPKGYYNATDLNRAGAAVLYVAQRLADCGYGVQVAAKTDWMMQDFPTQSAMNQYRDNVATLRAALATMPTTPPTPPDMERLDWREANDIERILKDVDYLISSMMAAYYYAGELYAGEVTE